MKLLIGVAPTRDCGKPGSDTAAARTKLGGTETSSHYPSGCRIVRKRNSSIALKSSCPAFVGVAGFTAVVMRVGPDAEAGGIAGPCMFAVPTTEVQPGCADTL